MTSIKSAVFRDAYQNLDRAADALNEMSKNSMDAARESLRTAKKHGKEAGGHLSGAATNVVTAAGHTAASAIYALDGVFATSEAALRAVGSAATVAAAGAAAAGETAATGARWALLNLARGLIALSNAIGRLFGYSNSHDMIVSALGDPSAKRLSERLLDSAGDQLTLSRYAMDFAWADYAEAARQLGQAGGHLAGSMTNIGYFAAHSGAMAGNLALAAVQAGAPAVLKLAELGVRAAQVGVEFADKGVDGAREAMILSAEITAAAGNALAHPDQKKYAVSEKTLAGFQARLQKLQAA